MACAYSMDLRTRILADCDAGLKTKDAAAKYTVSQSWVRRLKQRRRQTGEVAPRLGRKGPVPLWQTHAEQIRAAVKDQPDCTLAELRDKLGLDVSLSTLCEALKALKLTFKKKRLGQPSRTGRT
jgi:transposase